MAHFSLLFNVLNIDSIINTLLPKGTDLAGLDDIGGYMYITLDTAYPEHISLFIFVLLKC